MALANVACLFGQKLDGNKKALVVDWDLEAPGQHYYLISREQREYVKNHKGVVELFGELQLKLDQEYTSSDKAVLHSDQLLDSFDLRSFTVPTRAPNVDLMPAGRLDDTYQRRLTEVNWEGLYRGSPQLYENFVLQLQSLYSLVLIDSRTGMTDISNICTAILPNKLVVVFTPNEQSLTGVEDLVRQSIEYRRNSSDLRSLVIYPYPLE